MCWSGSGEVRRGPVFEGAKRRDPKSCLHLPHVFNIIGSIQLAAFEDADDLCFAPKYFLEPSGITPFQTGPTKENCGTIAGSLASRSTTRRFSPSSIRHSAPRHERCEGLFGYTVQFGGFLGGLLHDHATLMATGGQCAQTRCRSINASQTSCSLGSEPHSKKRSVSSKMRSALLASISYQGPIARRACRVLD